MTWEKLPALEGKSNPCANCPPILAEAHPEKIIAVGFGDAHVERDGVEVYREPQDDMGKIWDFANAERVAAKDPDHDWRAVLFGPLHGETYQRQDGKWVLVEKNEGFA
jgi:hypothetical protein